METVGGEPARDGLECRHKIILGYNYIFVEGNSTELSKGERQGKNIIKHVWYAAGIMMPKVNMSFN